MNANKTKSDEPGLRDRSFHSYFSSFASFAALRETAFSTQRRKARQEIAKKKNEQTEIQITISYA